MYIKLLIIILLLASSVAYILSSSIKQTLMGYEPWQLVKSYVAREDVLEALDEGIISEEIIGSKLDKLMQAPMNS